MKAEAVQKNLCAQKAMRYLSEHPEQVRLLTDYWANTQRLLALNLLFVPLEMDIVEAAQPERRAAGLLTNDSMIVAAMRAYGISHLATRDDRFNDVAQITVFSPSDIA
jgi:predicted nucleic acid-binding protein